MKILEKVLVALVVLGVVMSLFLITGGGLLSPIALLSLAIFYALPNSLKTKNSVPIEYEANDILDTPLSLKKSSSNMGVNIALPIAIIGMLFKFMSYPGAMLMLNIGVIALAVVGVFVGKRYFENKALYYKQLLIRVALVAFIGVFLLSLPPETIFNFKFRNHPDLKRAIEQANANPNNDSLQYVLELEWDKKYRE